MYNVVAIYEDDWYIAQVEGEDPDEETEGFTLLNYMYLKGFNKFSWGKKKDILKTNDRDIICAVSPPISVSSWALGLNREDLEKVRKYSNQKWLKLIHMLVVEINRYVDVRIIC